MIFTVVRDFTFVNERPPTTGEIAKMIEAVLPMCADHFMLHLLEIEKEGLVIKKETGKGFAWEIPPEIAKLKLDEIKSRFPELYEKTIVAHPDLPEWWEE